MWETPFLLPSEYSRILPPILQISERDASGAKLISMPPLATVGDIRGANIVIYVTKGMLVVGYAGGRVVGRRVV